jgi:outer membrane protein assembly factor BamD (BamD/ComL family)
MARFPNDRVSEQAAFMVGFTYAEEMQDYASARTAFEEFKQKYPQSDLVKSAQWMLDNMEKSDPPFEGDAPEEGVEQGDGGE